MDWRGKLLAVTAASAAICCSCERYHTGVCHETQILLIPEGKTTVKSEDPDENLISDANIFIFNKEDLLEKHLYLNSSQMDRTPEGGYACNVSLLEDCIYSVYVCCNTGFMLPCSNIDELQEYRFHMAYPDDYRTGLTMSGKISGLIYSGSPEIEIPLKRAMSRISVRIDRSRLDSNVEFMVTRLQIGNCPESVSLFGENRVSDSDGTYISGFSKSGGQLDPLNRNVSAGMSGEVSLYMFENIQGYPLGEITGYSEKVIPGSDPLAELCSYVELTADYISDDYYSLPGKGLVYRFYLGGSISDFNVERNCHYHITVIPEGSGIEGDGWRVDKTGIGYRGPTDMSVYPGNYIRGKIGDTVHIRCELIPEYTPLDIGEEHLEYDMERGIYSYKVDEDRKGVVLTLTGSGRGLIYMEAGEPVNDAELIVVEVDLQ